MGSATNLILQDVGGGGAELTNAIMQARGQRVQGKFEQQQHNANARMQDLGAYDAYIRGERGAAAATTAAKGVQADQRVAAAGNGADVNYGSAAAAQVETGALGELDALTIRSNAWNEAMGHRAAANDDRTKGKLARIGANMNAQATIATGGMAFARSLMQGARDYERYGPKTVPKKDETVYVKPPSGKRMSDPRNR